ncbi:MAG: hypothetical protein N3A54_06735 [Patescibacteria group bacterium]|nr:hypothetical protein [Patescibacteria group bacterium]
MTDIFIICMSGISFLTYMIIQAIFGRFCRPFDRLGFLLRLQVFMGCLLAGSLSMTMVLSVITPSTFVLVLVCSQAIFHGLVIVYIVSIFSYLDSSITVKLFFLIIQRGKHGIKKKELMKMYSTRDIVKRKLDRLVAIGVLKNNQDTYEIMHRLNVFMIREKIFSFIKDMFP